MYLSETTNWLYFGSEEMKIQFIWSIVKKEKIIH